MISSMLVNLYKIHCFPLFVIHTLVYKLYNCKKHCVYMFLNKLLLLWIP